MSIAEVEKEIIEEFELFAGEWELKYQHLIDLGKSLPLIDPIYKTDEYSIVGCQNKVWLHSGLVNGKVVYTADSDGYISKGMVALLVRTFSNQKPEDILNADLSFIDTIGLKEHLALTRANGLVSMIKQMKLDALALKGKL